MEVVEDTCSDESVRSSDDDSSYVEENKEQNGNPKLADALAKAIRMGKTKKNQTVVLSKAKLYNPKQVKKKSDGFEIVPDPTKEIKTEEKEEPEDEKFDIKPSKKQLRNFKLTKQEKLQRGRLKPSVLDREKERPLVKIATRGVVQLFNAVRQQQNAINKEINKPGLTEGKKEKILKSIDKKAFLEVLMGKSGTKSEPVSSVQENEVKSEPEDEEPSWKVLRDDFMMGAKLKDWDKKDIEIMDE